MSMEADLKGFSKIMGQEPRMSHRPVFLWVPACLECVLMSALYKGAWLTLMHFGPKLNGLSELVVDDVQGSMVNPNIN